MRVSNLDLCARSEVAGKESKPDPSRRTDHQGCGAKYTGWTRTAGPVGRNWNVPTPVISGQNSHFQQVWFTVRSKFAITQASKLL
jgi:hypothetical protein